MPLSGGYYYPDLYNAKPPASGSLSGSSGSSESK